MLYERRVFLEKLLSCPHSKGLVLESQMGKKETQSLTWKKLPQYEGQKNKGKQIYYVVCCTR
jgi:hypothetical protein